MTADCSSFWYYHWNVRIPNETVSTMMSRGIKLQLKRRVWKAACNNRKQNNMQRSHFKIVPKQANLNGIFSHCEWRDVVFDVVCDACCPRHRHHHRHHYQHHHYYHCLSHFLLHRRFRLKFTTQHYKSSM